MFALKRYLDPAKRGPEEKKFVYWENDEFVVIYDRYPKSKYHLLILSKKENIDRVSELRK